MLKKVLTIYKLNLLIALVVFVVFLALRIDRNPITIGLTLFGAVLGAFVLDLDYIFYAYLDEPTKDFSINVKAYLRHKDISQLLTYIQLNKNSIKEKTLNSALFQMVLAPVSVFVTASPVTILLKALVLTTFAVSIYKVFADYLADDYTKWFWALKDVPEKKAFYVYVLIMVGFFVGSLYFI